MKPTAVSSFVYVQIKVEAAKWKEDFEILEEQILLKLVSLPTGVEKIGHCWK